MMKPIYEFQTIQVELTNACIHSCSNCTRFCGHHKKPFFMDWDTFKKAIDTLENWPRFIGIMGGEPTLHPEFERFVHYANEKHPPFYNIGGGHKPIPSLSKYMIDANKLKPGPLNKFHGLGLWSSVCDKYYDHYEQIQDTFIYQCINDHTASSHHQAWLMTRKEFGIGDDEWVKLRDNCWWQRLLGSPSITPKGAFFCEVAAAMDMLFDGPGGWKIEKDWWKRGPEDYKEQLHWCEFCSGAFLSLERDANEMVDDVSPVMFEKLKQVGSPKLSRPGAIQVHDVRNIPIKPRKNLLLYQPDHELRFTEKNTSLYPRNIWAIAFLDQNTDCSVLIQNRPLFDDFYVVTDDNTLQAKLGSDFKVILRQGASDTRILAALTSKATDWLAVVDPTRLIDPDQQKIWKTTIFNPGTLHIFSSNNMMMFNVRAKSYRNAGFDGISALTSVSALPTLWPSEKVAVLEPGYEHIVSPDIAEWNENITKAGIRNWNYLDSVMSDLSLQREVLPQLDSLQKSGLPLWEMLCRMDQISPYAASPVSVCNKIKTAIHNELAHQLADTTLEDLQAELEQHLDSFCVRYALAMLTVGIEKENHLKACVLNTQNTYHLGLATLKLHYDAYHQKQYLYQEQTIGFLPEILQASSQAQDVILIGNHYPGMSIEMILSAARRKPCCFIDEDRQGFGYDGLETLSVKEALSRYPDKALLWTECGDTQNYHQRLLERAGVVQEQYKTLHPLNIAEMCMTPEVASLHLDNNFLRDFNTEADSKQRAFILQQLLSEADYRDIVD